MLCIYNSCTLQIIEFNQQPSHQLLMQKFSSLVSHYSFSFNKFVCNEHLRITSSEHCSGQISGFLFVRREVSACLHTAREHKKRAQFSLSLIIVTTFEKKRRAQHYNHRPHPHSGTFLNVARFGVEQCAVQYTTHPSGNPSRHFSIYTLQYI